MTNILETSVDQGLSSILQIFLALGATQNLKISLFIGKLRAG